MAQGLILAWPPDLQTSRALMWQVWLRSRPHLRGRSSVTLGCCFLLLPLYTEP